MTTLSASEAFSHVEDSYRWLAASACSLDSLARMAPADRRTVDTLLPNVDVALQAAILVYGRALIEFYVGGKYSTNIGAKSHFAIDVLSHPDLKHLKAARMGMHVHLTHITEYRDPSNPERAKKPRPDWNAEIPDIVDRLVNLLKSAVDQRPPPKCHAGFTQLLTSTMTRRTNPRYEWPKIVATP
jgi:hypothetical protein